jgi:hypothetical protein
VEQGDGGGNLVGAGADFLGNTACDAGGGAVGHGQSFKDGAK